MKKEIIMLIIGILSGAIVSWLIARYYYRRSNKDQRKLFDKIPEEIKRALREDQREKLTVKELNELIESKTIDKQKVGLEIFKACPKCGSTKISMGEDFDVDWDCKQGEEAWPVASSFKMIECPDCGWRKDEMDVSNPK